MDRRRVDFNGKWVQFETLRMDPKPIQKPHIPIIVGGYADAALRRAVRYGAGWYGFNRDIAATKDMLERLDATFAKAGKARGPDFQIIITPPLAMPIEAMAEYAELGVHRLVVNLGSQRPERVGPRLAEIETLVRTLRAPDRLWWPDRGDVARLEDIAVSIAGGLVRT